MFAVSTKGRKCPAILALEISAFPIRQLADWATENRRVQRFPFPKGETFFATHEVKPFELKIYFQHPICCIFAL
jgi:hypothetical protein